MRIAALTTALVCAAILAIPAFADGGHTSNKWRIELDGSALKTGDMQFRVTPSQGESIDIVASVQSGRDENQVAQDVRDAFAAKLSPERFTVEVDDGEDILIKKKEGQPDFALELIESDVRNVNIRVEGE
jgi:hypothetical protein